MDARAQLIRHGAEPVEHNVQIHAPAFVLLLEVRDLVKDSEYCRHIDNLIEELSEQPAQGNDAVTGDIFNNLVSGLVSDLVKARRWLTWI